MIIRRFTIYLFDQMANTTEEVEFSTATEDYREASIEALDFGIAKTDELNERDYESKRFYWNISKIEFWLC